MPDESPSDAESLRFRAGIERMRRRWPSIAEAADHPLTEVILERCERVTRVDRLSLHLSVAAIVLFFVVPVLASETGRNDDLGVLLAFGLVIGFVAVPPLLYRRRRWRCLGPMDRLVRPRAADSIEDLWLTPIAYRELSALLAATIFLRPRKRAERLLPGFVWVIVGVAFVCMMADWAYYAVSPNSPLRFINSALLASGVAAAWISVFLLTDDREVRAEMRRLRRSMRYGTAAYWSRTGRMIVLLVVAGPFLLLLAEMGIVSLLAALSADFDWIEQRIGFPGLRQEVLGTLLWATAYEIWRISRTSLPRRTDRIFLQRAKEGQTLYEERVRRQKEQT